MKHSRAIEGVKSSKRARGTISPAITKPVPKLTRSNYRIHRLGSQGVDLYFSPAGFVRGLPMTDADMKRRRAGMGDNPELSKERAVRRARNMIRRLVLTHDLKYMWSFTFADDIKDLDEAWALFRLFYRRLHKRYPDLKYVVVPELQERGVWHFHMLIECRVEHALMAELWGNGFVWVSPTNEIKGAVKYITKYITKRFDDADLGSHRYKRSRNMHLDVYDGEAESLDEAWALAESLAGGRLNPEFVFSDAGGYFAIATLKGGDLDGEDVDGRRDYGEIGEQREEVSC